MAPTAREHPRLTRCVVWHRTNDHSSVLGTPLEAKRTFTLSQTTQMADPPWHFLDLGVASLQARSRGAGIRVGLLDSGVADAGGTFSSLTSVAPDGSPLANLDEDGHGTACASLIASLNDDAPGVAPEVELLSVRVSTGGTPIEALVRQGILTAARLKCDVISCSFVLPELSNATSDAIRSVCNAGVVIVAASGNDPTVSSPFPERTPNVLVVGPYDRDRRQIQSRFGLFTDVLAPGVDLSVVARDGSIAQFGESSGAAALTSAIVAIVLGATRSRGTAHIGVALEGLAKSSAMLSADGVRLLDPDRLLYAAQQLP
jgi:subtilisin family serine protease